MPIEDFIESIYLGDRACRAICIDGWNKRVVIQVDSISVIRDLKKGWDPTSDRNVENACLVFSGVTSVVLTPPGYPPNDYIHGLKVTPTAGGCYEFALDVASVDAAGRTTEVTVRVVGTGAHLSPVEAPDEDLLAPAPRG
jgi:hypothetical protein